MDCSSTAGAACDFLAYVGYAANQQRHEHRDIASWILRSVWFSSGDFAVKSIVYGSTFSLRVI